VELCFNAILVSILNIYHDLKRSRGSGRMIPGELIRHPLLAGVARGAMKEDYPKLE
jgi:hypothetical protein